MKRYIIALFFFCASLGAVDDQAKQAKNDIEFVILVASYNNERYVKRNLDSLMGLRSTNPYRIICVNDGSSDRTGAYMQAYAEKHQLPESFLKIVNNDPRTGSALENMYNVIHNMIPDHAIVLCVDGDDTLSFKGVLERLEKEYQDPDVWMTYGRFVVYPAGHFWTKCQGFSEEVIRNRGFRKDSNVASHLKTFRALLFKKIKKKDLLYTDGNFYKSACDMAMMYPMLEMCAPKDEKSKNHSVYIEDTILYVYNFDNPIGGFGRSGGRTAQIARDSYLRSLKPYEPLDSLFE